MTIRDMVARKSDFNESKDFIPTPPWATRVLFEEVAPWAVPLLKGKEVLDPAMGQGDMMGVFNEYGMRGRGSDMYDHIDDGSPFEPVDFTKWSSNDEFKKYPGIITNPPYKHLADFMVEGLNASTDFFALLVRVQALESQGRYEIFSKVPPTQLGIFSDRISFKTGKVVRKAPKMYFHVWICWDRTGSVKPKPPIWISPDAQQKYEKDSDYV